MMITGRFICWNCHRGFTTNAEVKWCNLCGTAQ